MNSDFSNIDCVRFTDFSEVFESSFNEELEFQDLKNGLLIGASAAKALAVPLLRVSVQAISATLSKAKDWIWSKSPKPLVSTPAVRIDQALQTNLVEQNGFVAQFQRAA